MGEVTPRCLVECLMGYPGYTASLLQLLEEQNLVPSKIRGLVSHNKHLFRLNDEKVKYTPAISICNAHSKFQSCEKQVSCTDLHICPKFILNSCKNHICALGHNWHTDHNMMVLKSQFLENVWPSDLCRLVQFGKEESDGDSGQLDVCHEYNTGSCNSGTKCRALHVCLSFVVGRAKCPHRGCQLNHDVLTPDCVYLLKTHGLSTNETPRDIVMELLRINPALPKEKVTKSTHKKEKQTKDSRFRDVQEEKRGSPAPERKVVNNKEKHKVWSDGNASRADEGAAKTDDDASKSHQLQEQEDSTSESLQRIKNITYNSEADPTSLPDKSVMGDRVQSAPSSSNTEPDSTSKTDSRNSTSKDDLLSSSHPSEVSLNSRPSKELAQALYTTVDVYKPSDLKMDEMTLRDLPSKWVKMGPHEQYRLVTLSPASSDYQTVVSLLAGKLSTSNITNIQRIQNPTLWHTLQKKIKEMTALFGDATKVDVRHLFYGTQHDILIDICANNFNWKRPGVNSGHIYGRGTYFSMDAAYSYDFCRTAERGNKYLLVAQVALGTMTRGSSTKSTPPINPETRRCFNTTTNFMKNPSVFVKQNKDECYPEYIITFSCI